MAFLKTWSEVSPTDQSDASLGYQHILDKAIALRERLAEDHNFFSDETAQVNVGAHKKVTLVEQADIGTGATGVPILGAQTVSGVAELLFTTEGNVDLQLTSANHFIAGIIGEVRMFAGPIAAMPPGFLLANGAAISRATYARLFSVLGTIHGVGDGSTTFNLPDLRNRLIIGAYADYSGIPKAYAAPGGGAGPDYFQSGGELYHAHAGGAHTHGAGTYVIPNHPHSLDFDFIAGDQSDYVQADGGYLRNEGSDTYSVTRVKLTTTNGGGGGGITGSSASDGAVATSATYTAPPFYALAFIIKF